MALARLGLAMCFGATAQQIRPCFDEACTRWLDSDGARIEAHGGSILRDPADLQWYWYGETRKTGDPGVNCYSSHSLGGPWRFRGRVLAEQNISVPGEAGPFIIERPKVLYNKHLARFVMWFHLDIESYLLHRIGVALAPLPTGPFTFVHDLQPDGLPSLDFTVWADDDQNAYFVRSVSNFHVTGYFAISGLTDDYLNTTGVLSSYSGWWQYEAFALFRHPYPDGKIHMIASHTLGWDPNPVSLFRLDGPGFSDPRWAFLGNPTRDWYSFNSQPAFVVPYEAADGLQYPIYLADNWVHAGPGLADAAYVWLPLRFEHPDGRANLDRVESWDVDQPFETAPNRSLFTGGCSVIVPGFLWEGLAWWCFTGCFMLVLAMRFPDVGVVAAAVGSYFLPVFYYLFLPPAYTLEMLLEKYVASIGFCGAAFVLGLRECSVKLRRRRAGYSEVVDS